jgi:demethylmenaquinone methyltransferase/2-methoxy-6-polyprenyl-1,4-benzoquinol methylase
MSLIADKASAEPAQADPTPKKLAPHAPLNDFYAAPVGRARFVTELFDRSARHYDALSRALSFGTDRAYRRHVLRRAGVRPGLQMLDVATGTGLMTRAALELGLSPADTVGLDPSRGMLEENRRHNAITLVQGCGEALPFADATFDLVVMGYALRHVEDLKQLFLEFRRVLKAGGRVLILEITRPQSAVGVWLMRWFFAKLLPGFTRLVTGQREPARLLQYYWATIAGCVPPETILAALAAAGFKESRRLSCGPILSDYLALAGEGAVKQMSAHEPLSQGALENPLKL